MRRPGVATPERFLSWSVPLSTPGASTTYDKQSRALSNECSTSAVSTRDEIAQTLEKATAQ